MTSLFNPNVSDEALDSLINKAEEQLSILLEVKQYRNSVHKPVWWDNKPRTINKRMTSQYHQVKCSCGHTTKYRVPLTTLDDFECPRKDRKEKRAR